MSTFRRCCRPGCGRPAVATLIYAYSESTAVISPLSPNPEPHAWDLCERHSAHITAPVGWELVRVEAVDIFDDEAHALEDEELTALAHAVREAGRVTTGLVENGGDPIEYEATKDFNDPSTSNHPVHRTKRIEEHLAAERDARRSHLHVVPDPAEGSEGTEGGDEESSH
ncbi:DUF3499 domain-containing protein [Corynebacterium sp. NML120713]|uniref:DUF3499 domain-containing protein n=1 Tax=unclassified Corynebacterium TaxID=2624378 RepID=UPI002100CC53|nr:DUF3499 domain-containing protein [Corynebacterium sp. NML120713]